MLSITGIYDGKNIYPVEAINERKKFRVIITFVEEIEGAQEDTDIRDFGTNGSSMSFWNDPAEGIFQDYLTKIRL